MSVIYVLLPIALGMAALGVAVFVWAARSGQFDDLETPAARILDEDSPLSPSGEDVLRTAECAGARQGAGP